MALQPLEHASRSTVFNALFQRMQTVPATTIPGATSWKIISQSLTLWDNVNEANQPAMFLHRGPQTSEQKHVFGVTKQLWKATIWVYYRVDGLKTKSTYPSMITDQMLDAFEQAFQTDPTNGRLTLGTYVNSLGRTVDICWHCWIDGTIVFDSGVIDNQAVIVIPISILV